MGHRGTGKEILLLWAVERVHNVFWMIWIFCLASSTYVYDIYFRLFPVSS